MPKVTTAKVDGVSYNVDHAKKIGKDAWIKSEELAVHFPDLSDEERHEALSKIFDQITAKQA